MQDIGYEQKTYTEQCVERRYALLKTMLQIKQFQKGTTRWVLKSPEHLHGIDTLAKYFPDAQVLFINRNEAEVYPSLMILLHSFRAVFVSVRDVELTKQIHICMERAELGRIPKLLLESLQLTFDNVVGDTVHTVAQVAGLPWNSSTEQMVRDIVHAGRGHKTTRNGGVVYELADVGTSSEDIAERLKDCSGVLARVGENYKVDQVERTASSTVKWSMCFTRPDLVINETRKGPGGHLYHRGPNETSDSMSACYRTPAQCCASHEKVYVEVTSIDSLDEGIGLLTTGWQGIALGTDECLLEMLRSIDANARGAPHLASLSQNAAVSAIKRHFVGTPFQIRGGAWMWALPLFSFASAVRRVRPAGTKWPLNSAFSDILSSIQNSRGATPRTHIDTDHFGAPGAEWLFYPDNTWSPLTMLNVWIPMRPLALRPLAFMDSQTIIPNDMLLTHVESLSYGWVHLWNLLHREGQRWFWDSKMGTRNREILFEEEGWTSNFEPIDISAWIFHTSVAPHGTFELPEELLLGEMSARLNGTVSTISHSMSICEGSGNAEDCIRVCGIEVENLHALVAKVEPDFYHQSVSASGITDPGRAQLNRLIAASRKLRCPGPGLQDEEVSQLTAFVLEADAVVAGLARTSIEFRVVAIRVTPWTLGFTALFMAVAARISLKCCTYRPAF